MKPKPIQDLLTITNVDPTKCEVQLCMAALLPDKGSPDFRRVTLGQGVAASFGEITAQVLSKLGKQLSHDHLVLHWYEAGTRPDPHEVECLDLSKHASIVKQIFGLSDIAALGSFDEDDTFTEALRFYVIVLRPKQGNPIFCFRTYSPRKELSQSKLLAITLQKGHYDRFNERLFLFDHYIDCFACGQNIFILKKDNFQKIFQFYEELVKTASQTLKAIKAQIPIDDFSAFEAACQGHLQKLAKLKNISGKPYFKKITMGDIKRVINRYSLPIKMVGKGKNEKLHFDTSDKWAILRLLDDDYLESVMTRNLYEVNSKRPLK